MVYVQRYRAFSTCVLYTNLKTRFEYGISHLVFLARYYHTNGTKSLRRLRNLSNKHKLSDRNAKRVMSRDCHVINFTFNNIFYVKYCPKLFFIVTRISIDQLNFELSQGNNSPTKRFKSFHNIQRGDWQNTAR